MKRICGFIMVLIMLLTGPASAIAKVARNEAKLLCLNIGKADCMLLLYGNTNWLIDTGYEVTYNALKTALDEYQIDHLDGVFLTHCHEDHDGGLMPLAQSNIPVNAWYASSVWFDVEEGEHPAVLAAKERGEEITWLSAGDIIPVDADTSFTVLGPLDINEENENNNSLVLLFSSPAGSILLCGDMKKDEEKDLLNAGNIPSCSLLKVGHHGDNGTFSKHFLTAVRPETAVISTSTAQEPDTPAPSTLHKLKEIGCAAYVTQDFHDAVLFTLSNGNVTSVEDIIWENAPPRIIGITLDIDFETDTITMRNTSKKPVSLNGYTIYSTKGDETLLLDDLFLKPDDSWIIGSRNAKVPVDQIWDEEYVWSNKKRDVGILYDPWGRQVVCADNGLME